MSESLSPVAAIAEENVSDDEKEDEQITNPIQKKEDAKVEKELDRVTDRVDEADIGSENIGSVCYLISIFYLIYFYFFSRL
jgi:hypothetical protein